MTDQPKTKRGGRRPGAGAPPGSGGWRPGAGRPVESVKLRNGQQWIAYEHGPDGAMLGRLVNVTIIGRNKVRLELDDGQVIDLIK